MQRLFIDVREPEEFKAGHIKGARNIPPNVLMNGMNFTDIPKDSELVLYCRTGSRSAAAMMHLKNQGYSNMVNGINKEQASRRFGVELE